MVLRLARRSRLSLVTFQVATLLFFILSVFSTVRERATGLESSRAQNGFSSPTQSYARFDIRDTFLNADDVLSDSSSFSDFLPLSLRVEGGVFSRVNRTAGNESGLFALAFFFA